MRLSPVDILNKRFRRSFRGAAAGEVQDFLREIAADYEGALQEIDSLKRDVEVARARAATLEALEDQISRTLLTAQRAASDLTDAASRQADAIVREASEAAQRDRFEAAHAVEEARLARARFVAEFKALMEAHLHALTAEAPESTETGPASPGG